MRTLSPRLIAAVLGRPAPTPEQEHVITAPLRPGVVVAGAGSGKTETMASRVVWLVANGMVAPDQVLGLTFTRKAAGELALRVRQRLAALAATGRVPSVVGEPSVSTYDAFAGRIVGEHGARLGLEPERSLLTQAAAWQRAARLVGSWDGPMDDVEHAPVTVVADMLDLHEQTAAHLTTTRAVAQHTERLLDLVEGLPPGPRQRRQRHSALDGVVRAQRTRLRILPLVERYRTLLAQDELSDFSTVAADAARVAARYPEVGQSVRTQFRLVLLDEFQDTSHAQLDLLVSLFGAGHAVTAVGDPLQSIYAWRGANADTLTSFAERFGGDVPVDRHSLRTSFRNSARVLHVANEVAEPLRTADAAVETLVPARDATTGEVRVSLHRTRADQARALAEQVADLWRHDETQQPPSVGVLVRKRDEIALVESALRERGIPVEVVGLDGLLTVPEVADVVALLRAAADPTRGDALMRLLTGPVMRMGPRDLDGLARWARHQRPEPGAGQRAWQVPSVSIAECLTQPPPPGWVSDEARGRLRRLAAWIDTVRSRLNRSLSDVVSDAVAVLGLDVETRARAQRTHAVGTAHLDRLVDHAAEFASTATHAGVVEFLEYLDAAEQQERGLRRAGEVHLGSRVQLLTVHAAKGLEWDVVAVVGLTDGGFPARPRTGGAWLTDPGTLPYPLRGDAAHLPHLDATGVDDQSALAARLRTFTEHGREVDRAEERRLAYVAFTRARHVLLCHGYRWGRRQNPFDTSPFLAELGQVPGVEVDVWVDDPGDPPDPATDAPQWPYDPLGEHRAGLEDGAARVLVAMGHATSESLPTATPASGQVAPPVISPATGRAAQWADDVAVLLAERDAERTRARAVHLPSHLSATQLVAAARDPSLLVDRLRRPMPVRPAPETRRGTAFHAWVEQHYGRPGLLDLDELPGAADVATPPVRADLRDLQRAFLASPWADREPRAVEAAFECVINGVVVRGRVDAVFPDGDGIVVVDWKTGPPPRSSADAAARSAQLAVYRQAFAALYDLREHQVRAVFHHVAENVTIDADGARTSLDEIVSGVTAAAAARE